MSVYEAVLNLVGDIPVGFEIIAWVFSAIVLIYLICSAFSIIGSVINYIAGK